MAAPDQAPADDRTSREKAEIEAAIGRSVPLRDMAPAPPIMTNFVSNIGRLMNR